MNNKPIMVWAWISAIMPFLIGSMFLLAPSQAIPPGSTINDFAKLVGMKNLVYSGLMFFTLYKKYNQVLVILLFGRGLTDVLDGMVGFSSGSFAVPYVGAFVTGIITLFVAYFLTTQNKK